MPYLSHYAFVFLSRILPYFTVSYLKTKWLCWAESCSLTDTSSPTSISNTASCPSWSLTSRRLHHWLCNGQLGPWRLWGVESETYERVREKEKKEKERKKQKKISSRQYLCLEIQEEHNGQDNEPVTSQCNMQTRDERSGFCAEPLGVSCLRKWDRNRQEGEDWEEARGRRRRRASASPNSCALHLVSHHCTLPLLTSACPKFSLRQLLNSVLGHLYTFPKIKQRNSQVLLNKRLKVQGQTDAVNSQFSSETGAASLQTV